MPAFAVAMLVASSPIVISNGPDTYFGFFMRGTVPGSKDPTVQQEMMKAHLGNFSNQFRLGKLAGAGPVGDPTGIRRGILVLTPNSDSEISRMFKTDPFIKAGIMTLQTGRWHLGTRKVSTEMPDPNAIEENRIVVITPYVPFSVAERHAFNVAAGTLMRQGVGGWVGEPGHRWVGLFQGAEDASLKTGFEGLSGISHFLPKVEVFPLYMVKGALKPRL